jgi:putative ABC transport system permease protein
MVTFMLVSSTSIASLIACFMSYRSFFNDRKQFILPEGQ